MIKHSIFKYIIQVVIVLLATGCSFHEPAPVVEQSNAKAQRSAVADGTYQVRPGDTLFGIAFSYGLDQRDLAQWNRIEEPYTIYPDQQLRLTAPSQTSADSGDVKIYKASTPTATSTRTYTTKDVPPASSNQKPVPPAPVANSPATKSPVTPAATTPKPVSTPTPAPAPTSKAPAEVAAKPPAKPASTQSHTDPSSWIWPTNGRLLRGFVAGDPARNGIDIAGNEGQDIKASAAGTVVYSGNGLIGYGELIIIKHSDNMLSAYAHNKVRLAKENQQVVAGQVIAQMGRNDRNEQLLHFEIRTKGKPVNPLIYLPQQ
jgi:lipoprotein NlpD